jgi:hypothetical protein
MSEGAPGPLAEEAARLIEAIGDWARGAAGGSVAAVGEGAECQVCPFCQIMALVRRNSPDTFGHLADASAAMIAAVRSAIDNHDHHHGAPHSSGVERIDLDDRGPNRPPDEPTDPPSDVAT